MTDEAPLQDYTLARRAMIDSQLRPQGVTDTAVLGAMATIPREDYVPEAALAFAYSDRAITVDGGGMIPPAPLGRLLAAALPSPGERALVIGAAPGYAAAVLRHIGLEVTEMSSASAVDPTLESSVDLIVIEGAVADLPAALSNALAPAGRIATALLTASGVTRLAIGRKVGEVIGYTCFADCEIAPLADFVRPPVFSF